MAYSATAIPYPSAYLKQWLQTAGDTVEFRYIQGAANPFWVFKCKKCGQNWHMGIELFPTNETIPYDLQVFVKDHLHKAACSKFIPDAVLDKICQTCSNNRDKHDVCLKFKPEEGKLSTCAVCGLGRHLHDLTDDDYKQLAQMVEQKKTEEAKSTPIKFTEYYSKGLLQKLKQNTPFLGIVETGIDYPAQVSYTVTWRSCSCGSSGTGNFCSTCGAKLNDAVPDPKPVKPEVEVLEQPKGRKFRDDQTV